jgi:hypothetical protein
MPNQVVVRQFKSRKDYERDVAQMMGRGYVQQSVTTTTSRRMLGCLFGIIGYWLLPKRTVFHVTYVPAPVAPPPPPPPPPGF